jgi:hypothetical protein
MTRLQKIQAAIKARRVVLSTQKREVPLFFGSLLERLREDFGPGSPIDDVHAHVFFVEGIDGVKRVDDVERATKPTPDGYEAYLSIVVEGSTFTLRIAIVAPRDFPEDFMLFVADEQVGPADLTDAAEHREAVANAALWHCLKQVAQTTAHSASLR